VAESDEICESAIESDRNFPIFTTGVGRGDNRRRASVMFKIPPQQYAGVVAALRSAATAGGSDKRQFTRMEVQAPVRLGIISNGKMTAFTSLSRDVSMGGIGLCQSLRLAASETFLIGLPTGKEELVLVCRATFCRPLADGLYCVGAQFESEADKFNAELFHKLPAHADAATAKAS
jgi:hypothetical protein